MWGQTGHRPGVYGAGIVLGNGRYRVTRRLNKGATAVVYAADDLVSGRPVALKVVGCGSNKVPLNLVRREVSLSSSVAHENIVQLLDVFAEGTELVIVWELISGGDLLELLNECGGCMVETAAAFYFAQLLRSVLHMHAMGYCHRDIKPENCMIEASTQRLKLIDFGLSKHLESVATLGVGTPDYMPPEMVRSQMKQQQQGHQQQQQQQGQQQGLPPYDAKAVDAWAMGVVLYLLVTGCYPFEDPKQPNNLAATLLNVQAGRCQPLPEALSAGCKAAIAGLLHGDPARRTRLEDLASNPWLLQSAAAHAARLGPLGGVSFDCGNAAWILPTPTANSNPAAAAPQAAAAPSHNNNSSSTSSSAGAVLGAIKHAGAHTTAAAVPAGAAAATAVEGSTASGTGAAADTSHTIGSLWQGQQHQHQQQQYVHHPANNQDYQQPQLQQLNHQQQQQLQQQQQQAWLLVHHQQQQQQAPAGTLQEHPASLSPMPLHSPQLNPEDYTAGGLNSMRQLHSPQLNPGLSPGLSTSSFGSPAVGSTGTAAGSASPGATPLPMQHVTAGGLVPAQLLMAGGGGPGGSFSSSYSSSHVFLQQQHHQQYQQQHYQQQHHQYHNGVGPGANAGSAAAAAVGGFYGQPGSAMDSMEVDIATGATGAAGAATALAAAALYQQPQWLAEQQQQQYHLGQQQQHYLGHQQQQQHPQHQQHHLQQGVGSSHQELHAGVDMDQGHPEGRERRTGGLNWLHNLVKKRQG